MDLKFGILDKVGRLAELLWDDEVELVVEEQLTPPPLDAVDLLPEPRTILKELSIEGGADATEFTAGECKLVVPEVEAKICCTLIL